MLRQTYRQRIVERHRRRDRQLEADMRREAAWLARLAAERYRFRRLYLFGSVARNARLAVWSDIDLAIEGLAPEDYWPLVGMLTAEAKYPLDVKVLEDMPAASRHEIRASGVVLHEG